jgi:hypothetical protein
MKAMPQPAVITALCGREALPDSDLPFADLPFADSPFADLPFNRFA